MIYTHVVNDLVMRKLSLPIFFFNFTYVTVYTCSLSCNSLVESSIEVLGSVLAKLPNLRTLVW